MFIYTTVSIEFWHAFAQVNLHISYYPEINECDIISVCKDVIYWISMYQCPEQVLAFDSALSIFQYVHFTNIYYQ